MGSPPTEVEREPNELQHMRKIDHTVAISAKSVTLEQYRALTKEKHEIGERWTNQTDFPAVAINWFMAAKYCNLLSKEEGLPEDQWCYEIKGDQVSWKANHLKLRGYRLPTEAEMEFVIRAGAVTSFSFGETDELLGRYAWFNKNSSDMVQRVGFKKPNDLGLFDMHGNCFTWCDEPYADYPAKGVDAIDDRNGRLVVAPTVGHVLRGGSFFYPWSVERCAYRLTYVPTHSDFDLGFRLARTISPDDFTTAPPKSGSNK